MSLASDFRAFALKGNVVDLAVAVVIGGAFGKIVSALVSDVIMPVVTYPLKHLMGNWREYQMTDAHLKVGDFAGAVLDFIIIAFVLFLVVVKFMGAFKKKDAPPPTSHTRDCPECLETIPLAAKRCKACGSAVVV